MTPRPSLKVRAAGNSAARRGARRTAQRMARAADGSCCSCITRVPASSAAGAALRPCTPSDGAVAACDYLQAAAAPTAAAAHAAHALMRPRATGPKRSGFLHIRACSYKVQTWQAPAPSLSPPRPRVRAALRHDGRRPQLRRRAV